MKLLKVFMILGVILLIISCSDDGDLKEASKLEIEKRQTVIGDVVLPVCVEITIFIDPNCDQNWLDGTADAIDAYNNLNDVAIIMTEVTQQPADIEISCADYDQDIFIALGEWPEVDNALGGEVFINNDFNDECPNNMCWYQGVMMHELGHNLGLAHGEQEGLNGLNSGPWVIDPATGGVMIDDDGNLVNATPDIDLPGVHIDGTATGASDGNSVFNAAGSGDCDNTICTFSEDDILALQTLYPICECADQAPCECDLPEFTIDGPNEFCFNTSDEQAVFCASGLPPGSTISASGDGFSSTTNGNCVLISFDDPGIININIEVCIDGCCTTIVKTVAADNQCCNICYCECETPIEGTNPLQYETVKNEISCLETESCDELFPIGDEYFDCRRISVPKDLDYTISGDDHLCWDEEGQFCIGGLPFGTGVDWVIYGPNGTITDQSSGSCLYITFSDLGSYTVTAEICEGECCQVLTHTVEYSACEECFCECWELIDDVSWIKDGFGQSVSNNKSIKTIGKLKYRLVQLPIDCEDDCDEQYPTGDEYFDCVKIMK